MPPLTLGERYTVSAANDAVPPGTATAPLPPSPNSRPGDPVTNVKSPAAWLNAANPATRFSRLSSTVDAVDDPPSTGVARLDPAVCVSPWTSNVTAPVVVETAPVTTSGCALVRFRVE